MTRPADRVIALLSAIGILMLISTSSVWGPTVDNLRCTSEPERTVRQ